MSAVVNKRRDPIPHAVAPYSGGYRPLPLRNRSEEGVGARIADAIESYGPLDGELRLSEESCAAAKRQTREHGWSSETVYVCFTRLHLWGEFGGRRVSLYSCDSGAYCDLNAADAFRRSYADGASRTRPSAVAS